MSFIVFHTLYNSNIFIGLYTTKQDAENAINNYVISNLSNDINNIPFSSKFCIVPITNNVNYNINFDYFIIYTIIKYHKKYLIKLNYKKNKKKFRQY